MINATVISLEYLTGSILKLILKPDLYVDYQAGQYLQILYHEEALSYSIANAPLGSYAYELHLRDKPMFEELKNQGYVSIRLPLGECYVERLHRSRPIIFIAGGTGFAPIKSMIEQLLSDGDSRSMELFWGVRSHGDLYLESAILDWQAKLKNFKYFPVLSDTNNKNLVELVLEQHADDISNYQIVVNGPFDMAVNMRDILLSQGLSITNLFSDAFSQII